jgi:3-keto-L-gulonate-6-phosphate decarboxylase
MGTRENKVEKYLDAEITTLGGVTRKWVSPGRDGVPDRIVILDGDVYFVEVKTVDGERSDAQEREHERLVKAGANVVTVYGAKGVNTFISNLKMVVELKDEVRG